MNITKDTFVALITWEIQVLGAVCQEKWEKTIYIYIVYKSQYTMAPTWLLTAAI